MTDYINPDTIFLEHFGPSDVDSHVRTCDFCITEYGRIDNLDIRFTDGNGCEISCNNVETQSENGPKLYLCDSNREKLPKSLAFKYDYKLNYFHENFQKETDSENLLRSVVFNLFLITIFDDYESISQMDFTKLGNRSNNLFFEDDPTKNLVNEIEKKTLHNLNKIVNKESVVEYWKNELYYSKKRYFREDDVFYTYYSINLSAENNILDSDEFVSQKLIKNINFVLSWVLQKNADLYYAEQDSQTGSLTGSMVKDCALL